jgi:hypothetical protein
MTETIANDWKAIHDRMQQIRAEQTSFSRRCLICNGRGRIPTSSRRVGRCEFSARLFRYRLWVR